MLLHCVEGQYGQSRALLPVAGETTIKPWSSTNGCGLAFIVSICRGASDELARAAAAEERAAEAL
jgi:hypothetical protein